MPGNRPTESAGGKGGGGRFFKARPSRHRRSHPLSLPMSALLKTMAQRLSFASRLAGTQLVVPVSTSRTAAPSPRTLVTKASIGKRELIQAVKDQAQLSGPQADAAVNALLDTIVGTVAKGE